ncbi:MAG: DNA-3-methyladenine glycosylase I [Planctomycetota bacterium]|nr:MAG: DNA-3-methyladenine glycosylase I [Planctomycetota bacterium]
MADRGRTRDRPGARRRPGPVFDRVEPGPDGRPRCAWCLADPDYTRYHDTEWGRPQRDERALFEKLCLEGFQAGLSWRTILHKREAFRRAFARFEPERLARFTERDVERLLADASIVRHRGKIEAAIHNARCWLALREETGDAVRWLWHFAPPPRPRPLTRLPAETPASRRLARELRRRGFRFVGPTTCYAFMQAMGLVNDHLAGCTWWERCNTGP